MTTKSKTDKAHKLVGEYQNIDTTYKRLWWEKAGRIWQLKKDSLYKYALGYENEESIKKTWKSFCGQLDLHPNTSYQMINLIQTYIKDWGYTKDEMAPYVRWKLEKAARDKYSTTKENAEEILAQSKPVDKGGISRSDFIEWLENNFTMDN